MEEVKHLELELGKGKNKLFIKIDLDPFRIWVDTRGFPQTAFLCALCDAADIAISKCGEKGKIERQFFDIEWVINEWGGDKEIVEAVKKRKYMILDKLPKLKEKYGLN